MILRDILETVFLLDRFTSDWPAVARWRLASVKQRWDEFAPVKIRQHLDRRDGFTEKKRDAAYRLLSTLAARPSVEGVAMLRPDGRNAHLGPFLDTSILEPLLAEMSKLAAQAGEAIDSFLPSHLETVEKSARNFVEAKNLWIGMIESGS